MSGIIEKLENKTDGIYSEIGMIYELTKTLAYNTEILKQEHGKLTDYNHLADIVKENIGNSPTERELFLKAFDEILRG